MTFATGEGGPCRSPLSFTLVLLLMTGGLAKADAPDWAFPSCASNDAPPPAEKRESLPGSTQQFSRTLINARKSAIDWLPQSHEPMPAVVAEPRKAGQTACGYCHLPDGAGRPENAKLAGLPQTYIISELLQMGAHERGSALPDYLPLALMRASIEGLTPQELQEVAAYFEHQRPRSFEKVVESRRVPAYAARCFVLVPASGNEQRLGSRILELVDQAERFELRDPRVTYTAYVPPGSVGRGRRLAIYGRKLLAACSSCHGADLRGGSGLAGPPIAGRFAGYLARQLYGFRGGARHGDAAQPMQAVAAQLSDQDIIDAVAYAASLSP